MDLWDLHTARLLFEERNGACHICLFCIIAQATEYLPFHAALVCLEEGSEMDAKRGAELVVLFSAIFADAAGFCQLEAYSMHCGWLGDLG